ncbi:MAG: TetR family transcriptional regulator [Cyclobacteriaceae bacterium]
MSDSSHDTTEAKIKEAASELFATLGLKGTTMRKVAEKADVNVALVNYYFRSKDKLFLSVFQEKFRKYSSQGFDILTSQSKALIDKVEEFIEILSTQMSKDVALPIFLIAETYHNPGLMECIGTESAESNMRKKADLQKILDDEHEAGNIRKISVGDFETAIASLVVFPILTKIITTKTGKMAAYGFDNFDQFLNHWKKTVLEIMKSYLRPI